MKHSSILGAVAAASLLALAGAADARGGGGGVGAGASMGGMGGQSNAHISAQGNLNTNGPTDRDFGRDRATDRTDANADLDTRTHTKMAGHSKSHISASGQANTNGLNATDRDQGAGRAEDRRAQ